MREIVPDYYFEFKCIADKCKHTCCAGWEIDIDEVSLERYKADGLGHISCDDEPHFILDKNERCPYLNENNLCELIIKHGEGYLCSICTDHPRFRNYWENLTETGLGMCCEAAARLILTRNKPMKLTALNGGNINNIYENLPDDEKYLWDVRNELLEKSTDFPDSTEARLYEYFVFRHIPDALYDGRLEERIKLVDRCFKEITDKWKSTDSLYEKIEIARAFSEDFEYDTDKIEDFLKKGF